MNAEEFRRMTVTEQANAVRHMEYGDLHELVFALGVLSSSEQALVKDQLADIVWGIGCLWDRVEGTDSRKGQDRTYMGTPNRRSMTYKLRKAAGFSYP